jgi:hypothetical protein
LLTPQQAEEIATLAARKAIEGILPEIRATAPVPRLLNQGQAADMLGVSRYRVKGLLRSGALTLVQGLIPVEQIHSLKAPL